MEVYRFNLPTFTLFALDQILVYFFKFHLTHILHFKGFFTFKHFLEEGKNIFIFFLRGSDKHVQKHEWNC